MPDIAASIMIACDITHCYAINHFHGVFFCEKIYNVIITEYMLPVSIYVMLWNKYVMSKF